MQLIYAILPDLNNFVETGGDRRSDFLVRVLAKALEHRRQHLSEAVIVTPENTSETLNSRNMF